VVWQDPLKRVRLAGVVRWSLVLSIAIGMCCACGSRSEIGESSELDDEVSPGGAGGTPATSPPTGGSGGAGGTGGVGASGGAGGSVSRDTLPSCVLGPPRQQAEAEGVTCNWLVQDRCYAQRIAACACACPRDRMSTCLSGLPGNEVEVTCF
jgi:hypothetical protein